MFEEKLKTPAWQPLADRLRPSDLSQYIGQRHLVSPGKPLYQMLESGHLYSMILWGPPGTGKTTLARILAAKANAHLEAISAVLSGVKEIRAAIDAAQFRLDNEGRATILFVDEIHRFNKSQQDAFLPHVETGLLTIIGATTENPSFSLNNALLSRARVFVLKGLSQDDLLKVIDQALSIAYGEIDVDFPNDLKVLLTQAADGDARKLLNLLEMLVDSQSVNADLTSMNKEASTGRQEKLAEQCVESINLASEKPPNGDTPGKTDNFNSRSLIITPESIKEILRQSVRRFDKGGDYFYDLISALHKSVRGSDPDAALYWFARMTDGGCDPLYIARRVVRMASEDVGNADPRALHLALDAWQVMERLGAPEGELAIAQAIVYLSCAAKSNAVYTAFSAAQSDAAAYGTVDVPIHLRNAPTKLMKELGYGKKYRYAHDEPHAYAAGENYFPEDMPKAKYYEPVGRGLEMKIKEKLDFLNKLDEGL